MARGRGNRVIRLRGVRQNNLKNLDLDIPIGKLVVITGLSGSGKSSLAFDTLYAEGQRRYIETFSPYARQFFDRMDRPRVGSIEGIPPAIAVEQRNAVRTTRSTVGTLTEVCDYMKSVWPHLARLYCPGCGDAVRQDAPQDLWRSWLNGRDSGRTLVITFGLRLPSTMTFQEAVAYLRRQGFRRLVWRGRVVSLEEAREGLDGAVPEFIEVVQDRVKLSRGNRQRFIEACEQAYHLGGNRLSIRDLQDRDRVDGVRQDYSAARHCARCDLKFTEPRGPLFSFNHPLGACPSCRGFGRIITIDYDLAVPDRSRSLREGLVKPWRTGQGQECQEDLLKFAKRRGVRCNLPFAELDPAVRAWVIQGDPDYGKDARHKWPHAWYGVKGYFRWLESKSYKMHVRVLLSRYRRYVKCPDCGGARLKPEALCYRLDPESSAGTGPCPVPGGEGLTLPEFYLLPLDQALQVIRRLRTQLKAAPTAPLDIALGEVQSRLTYLVDIGLDYLTLDRSSRSLSGGETQRVNLAACLGTRLVNTLFVLDEPTVGLHGRDTGRLIKILEQLRDAGNTVVVVEHDAQVIRAADQILDLGPGHGHEGGEIVYQGKINGLCRARRSLTGAYLSGRAGAAISRSRPTGPRELSQGLAIRGAHRHNLRRLDLRIPLRRFVCVTGVSGSGKTTLVREVLHPLLLRHLGGMEEVQVDRDDDESEGQFRERLDQTRLTGCESLDRVVMVDQSPIGRTPRSNPAVYLGAFDAIRALFARSEAAKKAGLTAGSFSFNSPSGQCERCRGVGFEKIEMQFLSDVYIRCEECQGKRYRSHICEIRIASHGEDPRDGKATAGAHAAGEGLNICELLELTAVQAMDFLEGFGKSSPARRARDALRVLRRVGLGYLKLGQPVNTLSGGESQRLKLARHLAEAEKARDRRDQAILFLFDEPTTGLHFDDVRILLELFQDMVDRGHSLVVVEHHLDVIRSADWVIDLGPGGGRRGGEVVASGPWGGVAQCQESLTGELLRSKAHGVPAGPDWVP